MVKNLVAKNSANDKKTGNKKTGEASANSFDGLADFAVPKASAAKKAKFPPEANVQMVIHHFSNDASLFKVVENRRQLFQVQLTHDAYPGLLYKFKETMQSFLEAKHVVVNSFPATFKHFEQAYDCMYVMTSDESAQLGAELVPYRKAFYIVGGADELLAWLDVMDTFLIWQKNTSADGPIPDVVVVVTNCTQLKLETASRGYECKLIVEDKPVFSIFSPFEAAPPVWTRLFAQVDIHVVNSTSVRVVFKGDTLSFREQFTELKIPGLYVNAQGEQLAANDDVDKKTATYIRVIKELDVDDPVKADFLLDVVAESVYRRSWVWVTWTGASDSEGAVNSFRVKLSKLNNITLVMAP